MPALQNVNNISFVVDTLLVRNGRKLGAIRPDADGYYKIPLAVLGTATDNRTYYEVEDFVAQLTSANSFINRCLTDGKLFGEYGHPMITLLPEDKQIPRLMLIDEKSKSHHIRKIETGEVLESGGRIIYGHVKPVGPYGENLKSELDDPCMNTAFSLRSIAHSRNEGGLVRRRIKHLVTFDAVNAGGYNEAAKRFSPGVECAIDIPLGDNYVVATEAAMEHLSDTEINEIFGSKVVTLGSKRITLHDKNKGLVDQKGQLQSIYTNLLRL